MARVRSFIKRALPHALRVLAWTAVGAAVAAALALAALTAFLGQVVHPFFYLFPAVIGVALIGIVCWLVLGIRRSRRARAAARTALVDARKVAAYRPPRKHGFLARRWLRVRDRVKNVKEGAL